MLFSTRQPTYRFNIGLLSSTLLGRSDLRDWDGGLKAGKNWALKIHGGMVRRPGTDYCDTLGEQTRLLPFINSLGQEYVLAFQQSKLLIFNSAGVLAQTITGCPWSASTMWRVRYTQRFDTAFIADNRGSFRMQKLVQASSGTFALSNFTYETESTSGGNTLKRCPFMKFADSSIQLSTSTTVIGAGATITLSSSYFINAAVPLGHVGAYVRKQGKQILITAVASGTSATGTIVETLSATTATSDWDEEAMSGLYGYETCVCFHSSRLFIAGPNAAPTQLWGSVPGAFYNFNDGTGAAGDAIWYAAIADQVTRILHLVSGNHLQIFTDGGVGYSPEGLSTPLIPADFDIRWRVPYAVSDVRPHQFDQAAVYCTAGNDAVRGFLLSTDTNVGYEDEFTSQLAAEYLTEPVDMDVLHASEARPEAYTFVVNDDGTLAVFLGARQEKVSGWMVWTTGPGVGTNEDGEGEYKAVCCVDQSVFFVVYRQVAGVRDFRLEKLNWDSMLDCSMEFEVAYSRTDWNGAAFFAGGTVQGICSFYSDVDGIVEEDNVWDLGDVAVADGSGGTVAGEFDTTVETRKVRLGYGFYPYAVPLPVEMNTADFGTTAGRSRRLKMIALQLNATRNIKFKGYTPPLLTGSYDPTYPPDPITGWRVKYFLGWKRATVDDNQDFMIEQTANLPCEVLSMARELVF